MRTTRPLAALAIASTLLAAGCGSSDSTTGSSTSTTTATSTTSADANSTPGASSSGAGQVKITLTGNTCTVDPATVPAGPVTFNVENVDAPGINEVELLSDQRILGEKENLAPGLKASSFTLTLGGGTYQVYCPGASTENQNLTVTGEAAAPKTGTTQTLLNDGAKEYATYVTTTLAAMKEATDKLKTAVDAGDVAAAKKQYALTRPFYERIESDVDGFVLPGHKATDNAGNLDYLLDMRQTNLDKAVGWHGYHAVERDLWTTGKITDSTKKLTAELATNVDKLVDLSKSLTYKPEDLANGAAGLLDEVQSEKIKGTEEAFSHLDLVDFSANVEGAQQAFAMLKPGLEKIDPTLTQQVATQFQAVTKALDAYRDASQPGGFKLWTPELRTKAAAQLSKQVQALQEPLSRIGEKVATAA